MEFLSDLWIPIVLSAVLVFIASSILHMVIPMHKSDYGKLEKEADVMEALRSHGVSPGTYMFPACDSMKEMGSPEMRQKLEKGPVGILTVMPPGGVNMGKSLAWWFVYLLVVSTLVAYLAWHALPAGEPYLQVFRVTGTAALLAYAVSAMADSIWKAQRWSVTAKFMFDGLVYAMVTAGTFGGFWPEGSV